MREIEWTGFPVGREIFSREFEKRSIPAQEYLMDLGLRVGKEIELSVCFLRHSASEARKGEVANSEVRSF